MSWPLLQIGDAINVQSMQMFTNSGQGEIMNKILAAVLYLPLAALAGQFDVSLVDADLGPAIAKASADFKAQPGYDGNVGLISQQGDSNHSRIEQEGVGNFAAIQSDTSKAVAVVMQTGNGNFAVVRQR
jgi:hypothetical protein